jgi:hypothetical protein
MTEAEFEYVATNRGTTLFPWGDDPEPARRWSMHEVTEPGVDVTVSPAGVRGLFSNAGEWTVTALFLPPTDLGEGQILSPPGDAMLGAYIVRGLAPEVRSSSELRSLSAEELKAAMTDLPSIPWTDRGARYRRSSFVADLHGIRCVVSARPRLERADLQITSIEQKPPRQTPK